MLKWQGASGDSSYKSNYTENFKSAPRTQQRNTTQPSPNKYEPLHSRRCPDLQRKVNRAQSVSGTGRSKPSLLSWSGPVGDECYVKPCVGDSLRRSLPPPPPPTSESYMKPCIGDSSKRTLAPPQQQAGHMTQQSAVVMETVQPLNFSFG